jgi:hypothetical protein
MAKTGRQRLEEGDARPDRQLRVAGEDFAGERHAGGLAAAGQQFLAQFDEAFRPLWRIAAPLALTVEQRPAPVRYALQKLAEKRRIHHLPEIVGPMR